MKILKGSGFDAKRPDRLDVAMCRDLPIKLVAWRRFQMAGSCDFLGVNFSVLKPQLPVFSREVGWKNNFQVFLPAADIPSYAPWWPWFGTWHGFLFFFWWTLNRIGRFLKSISFSCWGLAKTLLHSGLLGMYSSFKKGIASYITFTTSRPLGFPVFRRDSNIEFWGRSFSTSNARTVDLVVRGVPGTWKVRAYTNIYRISYPLPSWFLPLVINTCFTDDFRSRDRTWWIKVMEGNVDIGISGSDMLEEAMIFVCR